MDVFPLVQKWSSVHWLLTVECFSSKVQILLMDIYNVLKEKGPKL